MPFELPNYGFQIERTVKKLRQAMQRCLSEAEPGLTVDQWVLLDILYRQNGLSQNELAEAACKDAPTVTRIIDLLCQKELTERKANSSDRRKYSILLTAKGNSCVKRILPQVQTMRQAGFASLSVTDYQQLQRILNTIQNNIDQL